MPRVTEHHRAARREQILSAAARCFSRDGFHATSMDDVIAEAGLSAGAVYGYYRGKDELIEAAAGQAMALIGQVLSRLGPAATPATLIAELLAVMLELSDRFGFDPTRVAVQAWGESVRNPAVRSLVADGYAGVRAHIARSVPGWQRDGLVAGDADADEVAKVLFGLVPGFIVQRQILGDVDPDSYAEALSRLLRPARPGAG